MVEPTLDVLPATAWEVKVTPEPEPPTLRKRLGSPRLERQTLPGCSCQNRGIPHPPVVHAFDFAASPTPISHKSYLLMSSESDLSSILMVLPPTFHCTPQLSHSLARVPVRSRLISQLV
ncbi:hypothetical protein E5288_WYG007309 [Bos mutus]|uniref:Uncharacterized protein n=1 Tax=Bos mutus TaxID=72004 RepID=A0A6B0RXD7_9CETA|nr:hypothetical protein [Bos mutus]